jgi:protein-disulfide isomerase
MLRRGSEIGGRFRVLENLATATDTIALAEGFRGEGPVWLVLLSLTAAPAALAAELDREARFALGIPGLARPLASGSDGGFTYLAFAAPASGSVAQQRATPWEPVRVAALARRIADALGALHDQGIAYGCVRPELIAEGDQDPVLFGFGVAALATRFGAAGEASQFLPPQYRAPELRGALLAPTPQSDVFALGVLLCELLSAPVLPLAGVPMPAHSLALTALLTRATAPDPRVRCSDVRTLALEFELIARREAGSMHSSAASIPVDPTAVEPTTTVEPAATITVEPPAEPAAVDEPLVEVPSLVAVVARPSRSAALITVLVVLAGCALMIGGVTAAFVFATHRTRPIKTSIVPASPLARSRPSDPDPRSTGPEPSTGSAPPEPTSRRRAPNESSLRAWASLGHAAALPPGAGMSVFPEDARAALPVLGSEPIWGSRKAPVTWVLFADLECPYTRRLWRALEAEKLSVGDDLRIVFRHRPLREHPYALTAAEVLAGVAREHGAAAFFRLLHRLMQDDLALTKERLSADLQASGLASLSLADLAHAGEGVVEADRTLAGQFAVHSTPVSFVNGARVEGERSRLEIARALLDERRAATWVLAAGTAAKDLYSKRTSSNLIGVGEQDAARVCVPVADSPTRGEEAALVTLVEFSDFECPYCKLVEPTLKALLARYPKALRLVWKDYPLPQHKSARLLANFAAEAGARDNGKSFWTLHDGLFAERSEIDDALLGRLAGKAGFDGTLLLSAARAGVHDAAIKADESLAEHLGVNGTPTFFVNGRRIQGALPLEQFDALLRGEIASAERIVQHGVAPDQLYALLCE